MPIKEKTAIWLFYDQYYSSIAESSSETATSPSTPAAAGMPSVSGRTVLIAVAGVEGDVAVSEEDSAIEE